MNIANLAIAASEDLTDRAFDASRNTPPVLPANWYLLAAASDLRHGRVIIRSLHDREIVLFRSGKTETVRALAAQCAHMGCHLKHGTVCGDNLRCALHERLIGIDGWFLRPDGRKSDSLRQRIYPVKEQFGAIFVYVGGEKPAPFPVPAITEQGDFIARPAGEYNATTSWQSLTANGCDLEHLLAIHNRNLKEEPAFATPDPLTLNISYRSQVSNNGFSDRIMKMLSGNDISVSTTVTAGTFIIVESTIAAHRSFIILLMCPQSQSQTIVRGVIGLAGDPNNFIHRAKHRVAEWLFRRFLVKDYAILEGLEWHPPEFAHSTPDRYSKRLYEQLVSLPAADDVGHTGRV